jgi:uncharacterized phage protein (TIGR01671 family)
MIMAREIKFRGKKFCQDKWIYGSLITQGVRGADGNFIDTGRGERYPIQQDTIGQFIGIKDSKGREIYDGDILEYYNKITKKSHLSGLVIYNEHAAAFNVVNPKNGLYLYIKPTDDGIDETLTIIGNIYDNPELLKGGEV